ncbi:MAG: ABC transporter substrate-binding protein [Zestosphaera sp.]
MPLAPKIAYPLMVLLLLVGLLGGYFAGQSTAPVVTKTETVTAAPTGLSGEIPIGVIIPLTGPLSTFGTQYKAVAEVLEGKINDYLASIGRAWRIKILFEDSAADPMTCLNKLMVLHGRGVKVFLGIETSSEVSEIKSYVDSNKLLVISPSSTSPALAIKDMVLRYTPNDIYQGKAIARIMWLRGVRWVVPMWRGDAWGDGLSDASLNTFRQICSASGESCGVLEGIRYDPNAKEFSVEVANLNNIVSNAIANYGKEKVGVLLLGFEETAAIFSAAKAYPNLGEVLWQGSDGTAGVEPLLDPAVADFAVKVKFYNTLASPGVSPKVDEVKKIIKEKLGMEALGYTYFFYDSIWTVVLAIDLAGAYDGEAILRALPYVLDHYIGASGPIILDENGDRAIGDYDLWAISFKDGKYQWEIIGLYKSLTDSIEFYKGMG